MLQLTHSGVILGLTTAARFAPVLLLSPYAGLLVDRYPKRHVLLVTRAGLGLVSLTLGFLVLSGNIGLWQVVVLALAFGTFSAVDNPARQSFVDEVVSHDLIRNAVTLNSTTVNVARVIGPAIAAVLVSAEDRYVDGPRRADWLITPWLGAGRLPGIGSPSITPLVTWWAIAR